MPSDSELHRGVKMTKAELAALIGQPIANLDTLVRKGAPCERTGGVRSPLIFYTAEFFQWVRLHEAAKHGPVALALMHKTLEIEELEWKLWRANIALGLEKDLD